MKKQLLKINFILAGILLLGFSTAFSQDARTMLQFEDAEKAFNAGNYEEALKQLDAVEKQAGVTSKTLYLRIVAENKLFNNGSGLYENKEQLDRLLRIRKNADKYLKALSKQGVDDKYREIYKISESLQPFPKSRQEWQKTIDEKKEKLRLAEEKRKREREKAENDLYNAAMQQKTEASAKSYLNSFPDGKHRKEVEKIYADALYANGVKLLEKGKYREAQNYFNTYKGKYPNGDKIAAINTKKGELNKGLKKIALLNNRENIERYALLSYATDGNIGLEYGGMSLKKRVKMFISLEGKNPFPVIFKTPKETIPTTAGIPESIMKEYFKEIYFTATLGANIRITYPLWVYVAGGIRESRLMVKKDADSDSKKGDTYKVGDPKSTQFFPEVGVGARIIERLAIKAGVRLIDGDPVVKIGAGIAF